MEAIDQKTILDELLSGSNISQYMAFAYNLPAQAIPDDPSWVWPQLWSNPWLAMAVFTDMEEKDGMLSSVLEARKENVLSKSRRVIPASQKRQDIKVAEFIEETLESYFDAGDGMRVGLDHVLFEAMDAQAKGVSIGETIFANAPDRIFIKNVMFKPQHLFGFGEGELAAYSTGSSMYPQTGPLRLRPGIMLDNVSSDKPLPEYKFFVYSYRPRYSNRWGSPIDRRAYWATWFKRASLKQWLRFLEKGPGSVVTRYNDGASEDEQNKALDAARAINEESAVALARKFNVEVLQHVRQSMGSAYKEMVDDFCNNEIARIVLGQTLTSRGSEGGGSRALGEVHERVGDKKTEVDAKGLMLPVNTQLVWPLVLLNFGPNTRPPLWMIDYAPGADLTSMQKWLEGLHRMRLPMSKSSIYNSFPVNAPESEEDTLPPMSAKASGATDDDNDPAFAEGGEKKKRRVESELRQAVELEDGALSAVAPVYDEALGRIISDLEKLRDLREAMRPRFFEQYVGDFDPLSEVLGDALLSSYLLALNQAEESKGAEFDDPVQTGFELPPERAIAYFRRKGVVTSKKFRDMTAEAREAAFTVGGVWIDALITGNSEAREFSYFEGLLRGAMREARQCALMGLDRMLLFSARQ
jgi:phage gp29-like protein